MDFTYYEAEIGKIAEEIMQKRYTDPQACKEDCRRMIEAGHREEDAYLLGFGYYYLSESYFATNEYKRFIEYLAVSIPYQQKSSQWTLLTRSYNMMGVDAMSQGNTALALDHYLRALKYGDTHGCGYEMGMVYTNMGQLYMNLKEYESAVYYFQKAGDMFARFPENPFSPNNLLNIYTALGRCYVQINRILEAEEMERKIFEIRDAMENDNAGTMLVRGFQARLRHLQNRIPERDQCIAEIISSMDSFQTFMEIWEEVMDFGNLLLSLEKFEELQQLFARVEIPIQQLEVPNMKMEFLRLKIRYSRANHDMEKYQADCVRLFEYEEVAQKENIEMLRRSVELRLNLEEAKVKEKRLLKERNILKEKSERDALTDLPNRYRLNDYAEEIFEKADFCQKNLGVEVVDVDYFKQYNDGYGHPAGDECLRTIAGMLRQMMQEDENIFCCRYGGDEFVIIYYGKSDAEVRTWAEWLKRGIMNKKMCHAYSKAAEVITISQGICNAVPREGSQVWDYLYSADRALYEAKQKRKNSICLIHEIYSEPEI